MSHGLVIVVAESNEDIIKSVDIALAPFEESRALDSSYVEFVVTINAGNEEKFCETEILPRIAGMKDDSDKTKYQKLFKNGDYETIIDDWYGYAKRDNGDWGYRHNPNAQWDWYEIGGRYKNYFILKSGGLGSLGLVNEIDIEAMKRKKIVDMLVAYDRYNEIIVELRDSTFKERDEITNKVLDTNAVKLMLSRHNYWLDDQDTINMKKPRDEYIKTIDTAMGWAFIDKKGIWHQRGQLGWWGLARNLNLDYSKEWTNFLLTLKESDTLVAVDFHI